MVTTISYSEIDSYRQCPFKHQLQYSERWVAPIDSTPLDRGKRTHAALENWYADPFRYDNPKKAMERAKQQAGLYDLNGDPLDDIAATVSWMLDGYLEKWGTDPQWEIIAIEHPVEIRLPGTTTKIKGKIDLLVRDQQNRLWLIDHKTGSTLPKTKDLDLDVQFAVYAWAMMKLGKPVHGMIYNSLRTQRNKGPMELTERFSRTMLTRTPGELETIARDIAQDAREMHNALKRANKTNTDRPRHYNPDTCGWRCPFTEPCLYGAKNLTGGTRGYLREIGFVQNFDRH